MSNKNEQGLKKCLICRKTITDKNNKTHLCPEHQAKTKTVIAGIGGGALFIGLVNALKKVRL